MSTAESMKRFITLTALLTCAWDSGAQTAPDVGLLFNTKSPHSLTYRCEKKQDGSLDCEFTQILVRRKTAPEKLDAMLKRAREEFGDFKKEMKTQCSVVPELVEILEGRKKPKELRRPLTATQKNVFTKTVRAMQSLCKSPTMENFLALTRLDHDKDMRTCTVAANSYRQTFRQIPDGTSPVPAWVVAQDRPDGPCGFVNLSRFEADKQEGISYPFWKYTARRAVTNPNGVFLGTSCKGFDEDEYLYDWRSEEHSIGCDYIQFSVL
jgi:hypothetical protein